jgi:arsenate reductase
MAEAWTRKLRGEQIEPYSAGVEPNGVDPNAVKIMAEAGLDITGQQSKHLDTLAHIEFDYVITLCDQANESCPLFPGKTKKKHVGFDDPPKLAGCARDEEEALSHYRRVRDEIKRFVEQLPEILAEV